MCEHMAYITITVVLCNTMLYMALIKLTLILTVFHYLYKCLLYCEHITENISNLLRYVQCEIDPHQCANVVFSIYNY